MIVVRVLGIHRWDGQVAAADAVHARASPPPASTSLRRRRTFPERAGGVQRDRGIEGGAGCWGAIARFACVMLPSPGSSASLSWRHVVPPSVDLKLPPPVPRHCDVLPRSQLVPPTAPHRRCWDRNGSMSTSAPPMFSLFRKDGAAKDFPPSRRLIDAALAAGARTDGRATATNSRLGIAWINRDVRNLLRVPSGRDASMSSRRRWT